MKITDRFSVITFFVSGLLFSFSGANLFGIMPQILSKIEPFKIYTVLILTLIIQSTLPKFYNYLIKYYKAWIFPVSFLLSFSFYLGLFTKLYDITMVAFFFISSLLFILTRLEPYVFELKTVSFFDKFFPYSRIAGFISGLLLSLYIKSIDVIIFVSFLSEVVALLFLFIFSYRRVK